MYFAFQPYFRPMIWGSETWILSAYPNMESPVANGPYQGLTLHQLIDRLGALLMGKKLHHQFGNAFPLLLKIIDARDPLSIQVHPSDAIAQKMGQGSVGKTEMWYAMPCHEDAYLFSGLRTLLTPDTYRQHVTNHTIVDDLMRYHPHEGDCFFLPAGRIHAIGSGCHLMEIQQTSDLTYRIYDYDRRDANGQPRPLHTDLAAQSIDYTLHDDYETHYQRLLNAPMPLVRCPYFETTAFQVTESVQIDWTQQDRFLIIVLTAGSGELLVDGEKIAVQTADTLLLPATTRHVTASGNLSFLTITCP